jgi:hypothetical protein
MSLGVLIALLFGGSVIFLLLLGRLTSGTGADLLDWDPNERHERRVMMEVEDLDELLERINEDRRARGLPLLTHENVLEQLGEGGERHD